jgi:hypothetical protein
LGNKRAVLADKCVGIVVAELVFMINRGYHIKIMPPCGGHAILQGATFF